MHRWAAIGLAMIGACGGRTLLDDAERATDGGETLEDASMEGGENADAAAKLDAGRDASIVRWRGSLSAGDFATCARPADGSLWCWGDDEFGELGNGAVSSVPAPMPVRVSTLGFEVADVSAGEAHACATKTDGSVWCWGDNTLGQLGDGSFRTTSAVPLRVGALSARTIQISAGGGHSCAIEADGSLWCWGANEEGQLGVGSITTSSPYGIALPTKVTLLKDRVVQVSCGSQHTCAVTADGSLWCWGYDLVGQVGDGQFLTTAPYSDPSPVKVSALGNHVVAVSAGGMHTCALLDDGSLWCWGDNQFGELGIGSFSRSPAAGVSTPTRVTSLGNDLASVSLRGDHTCAVKVDGSSWCWGANDEGELGNGTVNSADPYGVATPTPVTALGTEVAFVAAGQQHTCAQTIDEAVWCWGDNGFGQVGIGLVGDGSASVTPSIVASPTQIRF